MPIKKIFIIVFLLSLTGCVPPTGGKTANGVFTSKLAQEKYDAAQRKVGHTYWADWTARLKLCDTPDFIGDIATGKPCFWTNIKPNDSFGPFLVKSVLNTSNDGYIFDGFYVVQIPDGSTKYLPVLLGDERVFNTEDPAAKRSKQAAKAKKECDHKGGVAVGMTDKEVLATCWGKPSEKNITHSVYGDHEQWVYGSQYLYFENGILTTIQTH